ncbi:yippee-domain-containing protein [Saitoella complicata NRRL Y-17804]|uniref:yippee-domain-containing protein n=1 Tax=Saitoella complicata (strain BCRC 22490 / CBS 7301 / JCM 7358 / NBRC 10748 / NRRL Y-17804) TaxID=698492 RepID=UPI000866CFF7|nr:yippee-domain-containing protein [Saitoella complicata NRRL Y-17804]ODQ50094.1 yippee-domain-containing protein [Saitoella complicata NRRL Y-17804]
MPIGSSFTSFLASARFMPQSRRRGSDSSTTTTSSLDSNDTQATVSTTCSVRRPRPSPPSRTNSNEGPSAGRGGRRGGGGGGGARDPILCCSTCHTHLTLTSSTLSKAFRGRYGPALLTSTLTNITLSPPRSRHLLTGVHVVRDAMCGGCGGVVGWKYIEAPGGGEQGYKVGRYVVEGGRVVKENGWGEGSDSDDDGDEESLWSEDGSDIDIRDLVA